MARHQSVRKNVNVNYTGYRTGDDAPIWDGSVLEDTEDLTASDVRTMARMYKTGVPVPDIAYIFRISSQSVIHLIKRHVRFEAAITNHARS
jgi:hypothetical protein